MREASSRPMLPALIALNPRTTNKNSLKVKGGRTLLDKRFYFAYKFIVPVAISFFSVFW
jgi:hypothetical protein